MKEWTEKFLEKVYTLLYSLRFGSRRVSHKWRKVSIYDCVWREGWKLGDEDGQGKEYELKSQVRSSPLSVRQGRNGKCRWEG